MNKIQLSVIFVNYNTKQLTSAAVKSVFDKTKDISFEVIIVDNNSDDGSVNEFKSRFGGKVKIIEAGENLGFGKGNNLGIEASQGKYVFLLNTDTLLINNAVKILYDFMEENPQAGVCGGNLYDANGIPTYSFRKKFLSEKESALNRIYKTLRQRVTGKITDYFNYSENVLKVDAVTGADMMIRKEALDKAGLFDKDFFMYLEEDELTMRIQKSGYFSYSVPQAKITHLVCGSFKGTKDNENRIKMHAYGEFLFFEKAYGKQSVEKYFKKQMRFVKLVYLLSLGFFRGYYAQRGKIINEAYSLWREKRA